MRNVSILSLSFSLEDESAKLNESSILDLVQENCTGSEDIVLLPEMCLGNTISKPDDAFLNDIAELAAKNKAYILAAIYRKICDKTHTNSAILFNRNGEVEFCYDKMYPYWSEFDRTDSTIIPGDQAVFADTDFGRVSATVCFDANFPNLWQDIADLDVELVLFSSAYSAGRQLMAHALNHHYAIVTATRKPDFAVYDIDGKELTYRRGDHNQILVSRTRVDLDKVICHYNFNRDKLFKMLAEHSMDMELEQDYDREEWCVIRSLTPEISAKVLCREYGIESLRDYQHRSRRFIDSARGYRPLHPNMV